MTRQEIEAKISQIVLANAHERSGENVELEIDVDGVAVDVTDFIYELIKLVGAGHTGANTIGNTSSPICGVGKCKGGRIIDYGFLPNAMNDVQKEKNK